MSFGFSIGDFVSIIGYANKIRKEFVQAPAQFLAISNEVRNLSFVMQDVEVDLYSKCLDDRQNAEMSQISESCRDVLIDIERMISSYRELNPDFDMKGKTVKRSWKRLQWEPADILDLRSRLSSTIGLLNAFNGRITNKSLAKLVQHQDNQERQAILNWLSPMTYGAKQNDYISRRQPGTGQWLLDSSELQDWIYKPKRTLFCPGMPGAGKTIFTSILIDELHSLYGHRSDIGIAFIYCNFQRHEELSPEHLLANILRQLVHSNPYFPENLKLLYNRHTSKESRPAIDEISNVIHLLAQEFSQILIVIDALDECLISDRSRIRILDEIFNLQAKHNISFLATSRSIPEIATKFCHFPWLEICASTSDVMTFLYANMNKLPSFVSRSPELQHEITNRITDAAGGVFLLAQLLVDSLVGKRSPKAIRSVLDDLSTGPKTYDAAYNDAMQRIEGQVSDQRDMAKEVLMWITCAKRELTTLELQTALAVEVGETGLDEENFPDLTDMVSACAGLVTVDEQSNIIRLVHFTAQEYFQRTWMEWFPNAHNEIARICVTYLLFDSFGSGACYADENFEERLREYPLFSYAAEHWGHHAHIQVLDQYLVMRLLNYIPKLEACVQGLFSRRGFLRHSQQAPKGITGLHLAACFGLKDIVRNLISESNQIDAKDTFGRTPLSWAAANYHEAVVEVLLNAGVDPDSKDMHGRTPLSRAAFTKLEPGRTLLPGKSSDNQEEVVKHLLEVGADPESRDEHGRTPLSWAALNGHEAVVSLLLGAGADPGSQGEDGRTPLARAALNGHESVVKLLFEKGAEIDSSDKQCQTPVSCTASNGHDVVVSFLLQQGADPNSKDEDGRTPLLRAASSGHEKVVKLLLTKGAYPDSEDEDGRTPLSWAVSKGREEVVRGREEVIRALLAVGVDPDHADLHGRTPLSWAASSGHDTVIEILLESGAVLNSKDSQYRSPLSWAALYGHEKMVKFLLEKGADPDSEDKDGRTPLSWAVSKGREEVVRALLTEGVDPDHADLHGRTPLSWAASTGHDMVMQLLLDSGAAPDSKDEYGRTPLLWAALKNHEAIVKLLLELSVDVNTQDHQGWTSLSLAVYHGCGAVISLLEGKGFDLDSNEKEISNLSFIVRVDR